MNKKVIDYIQREVSAVAKQKYPDDLQLQWIYISGFITAQLAQAVENDNRVISQFKEAVQSAKDKL